VKKYLALLLLISSCSPVYLPNSRNSPMFKDGGEVQLGASIGNGVEVQGAFSVSKHIGFMANYYNVNRTSDDLNDSNDSEKHRLFEAGVGYYTNPDAAPYFFELYAGYGEGKGSSHDVQWFTSVPANAAGRYNKIFIQPAIGFNKKSFHMSFVQRVSIIDFTHFEDGTTRLTINEKSQAFYEPAFIGRFNIADDHIYLNWQTGFSIPLFKDPYFDYRSFIMSAGLGFRIYRNKPDSEKKFRDNR
jgi:hypothetical protein